jgi:hypothetical protein
MSPRTLDRSDPTLVAAIAEVERTITALREAQRKFNRCSKPSSRAAAQQTMQAAEVAYRAAAGYRDELVAQLRQDPRGHAVPACGKGRAPFVCSLMIGHDGPCSSDGRPTRTKVRPLDEAPKDATYILALATDRYSNRRWLVVHWAQGGGEEQPPFRGWFYWCGDGNAEIDPKYILGWMPLPEVPR